MPLTPFACRPDGSDLGSNGAPPKIVKVDDVCSSAVETHGPFTGFTKVITFQGVAIFGSVSTTSTSFIVGGSADLGTDNYWYRDFGPLQVKWNTGNTLYVLGGVPNQPFSFDCLGI